MNEITWTDTTNRDGRPYANANRWEIAANGTTYVIERTMSAYHLWNDGGWLGMFSNREAVEEAIVAHAPSETPSEPETEETSDADVIKAFEAKADEIAKANGWTIARAETVMLRYLRDTSPAEAATVAAALTNRRNLAA